MLSGRALRRSDGTRGGDACVARARTSVRRRRSAVQRLRDTRSAPEDADRAHWTGKHSSGSGVSVRTGRAGRPTTNVRARAGDRTPEPVEDRRSRANDREGPRSTRRSSRSSRPMASATSARSCLSSSPRGTSRRCASPDAGLSRPTRAPSRRPRPDAGSCSSSVTRAPRGSDLSAAHREPWYGRESHRTCSLSAHSVSALSILAPTSIEPAAWISYPPARRQVLVVPRVCGRARVPEEHEGSDVRRDEVTLRVYGVRSTAAIKNVSIERSWTMSIDDDAFTSR